MHLWSEEKPVLDQHAARNQPQSPFDGAGDREPAINRTFLWVGVAGLSAALAFAAVRILMSRRPADETSQRIAHLIDEANHLLKTLDDKRGA